MGIALLGGNPAQQPASFSRFVLPFAYRLEARAVRDLQAALPALRQEPNSWSHLARWEPVDANEPFGKVELRTRVDYYTAETAEVLFGRRTRRFRLTWPQETPEPAQVLVTKRNLDRASPCPAADQNKVPGQALTVVGALQAPELILFEFDVKDGDPDSPLHMGLLVHTVYFDTPLDSSALFAFNECFRNTRRPFPEYGYTLDVSQIPWLPRIAKRCVDPACAQHCADGDAPFSRLWHDALDAPLSIAGAAWHLFSAEASTHMRHAQTGLDTRIRNPMVHADYRTHTWTAAVSPVGAANLCDQHEDPLYRHGWLRLLNIDGPGWDADITPVKGEFLTTWLKERTYQRWAPGSLYGFTPHSGAAWLPDTRSWDDPTPLQQHFHTLYFDQLTLMLYLRSALFGFSRDISLLTRRMQRRETTGTTEFSRLERQFSVFTNLYQFPLLSHQQQALEMYVKLRNAMDIDDFYKEVQDELRHMAEAFDRRHDRQVRTVGVLFAVLASAGVLWDALELSGGAEQHPLQALLGFAALTVGLSVLVYGYLRWQDRKD